MTAGQLVQHADAIADDVLVGAEQVVGQGLPVRKQHHRRIVALIPATGQVKLQRVSKVLCATAVGSQHHKQMILAACQFGQHGSHAAAVQPGPVFVVLAAGGEEAAVGE